MGKQSADTEREELSLVIQARHIIAERIRKDMGGAIITNLLTEMSDRIEDLENQVASMKQDVLDSQGYQHH